MNGSQLVGPIGGALVALAGVAVTIASTSFRDRKARINANLTRLVEKRYDLYLRYIDILDYQEDRLLDRNILEERTDDQVVNILARTEREMQLFAGQDVLSTFEECRELYREIAAAGDSLTGDAYDRMAEQLLNTKRIALAAVRAELDVDSHDNWRRRWRSRRTIVRLLQSP